MKLNPQVITEYQNADPSGRAILERIFGKEVFENGQHEAMKLFADFCTLKGLDASKLLPYPKPSDRDQRAINAFAMLIPMIADRRKGWLPDFNDSKQYKWWPYFDMSNSGFAFAISDYGWAGTSTRGGSRLCLVSDSEASKCGKELLPIWREFLGR